MEKRSRTHLLTGLVLVVVFGAGILLGVVVDRSVAVASPPDVAVADSASATASPARRRPLYEQVGPTADQMAKIDSIIGDYREAMKALHAEFRAAYNPRYEALVRDTRKAIDGIFTPAQAQAYDSLLADYERRKAERAAQGTGKGKGNRE